MRRGSISSPPSRAGSGLRAWVLLALLAGCGNGVPSVPDAGVDGGPEDGGPATMSEVQDQIFRVNCTTATCHSIGGAAGDLILTKGRSYSQLVNVLSTNM